MAIEGKVMSINTQIIPNPLTIDEVAEIVGVHRDTVKQWLQDGKLGSVRIGHRTIRIMPDALDKFLREREEQATFVPRVDLKERKMKENKISE